MGDKGNGTTDQLSLGGAESSKEVLAALNDMRKAGTFCDVTVKVDGHCFPAHKNILAVFSPVLKEKIETCGSKSGEYVVELFDTKKDVFEKVLDFAYTCDIDVEDSLLVPLLMAADQLKAAPLSRALLSAVQQTLNYDNFASFYSMTKDSSCAALSDMVKQYVVRNFREVCQLVQFLEWKLEMLIDIISSDELDVANEEEVFEAVLRWTHHREDRKSLFPKVFRHIRLARLSPKFILERVKTEEIVWSSVECMQQFFMMQYGDVTTNCAQPRLSPSGTEVILVGGADSSYTNSSSSPMYLLSIETGKMEPLKKPETKYQVIATAVTTTSLYVWTEEEDKLDVIWEYNSRRGDWKKINASKGSCAVSRCCSGFVALDGCLFSNECGGYSGGHSSRRLRRYDIQDGIWSEVAAMPENDKKGVLAVANGKVYTLNSDGGVYSYDPNTNLWCKRPGFANPSEDCNFLSCVYDGLIIVLGRGAGTGASRTRPQVYHVVKDAWVGAAQLSKNYLNPAAMLVLNGRLTFIDQTRFPILDIERFCADKKCYETFEKPVKLDSNLIKDRAYFQEGAITVMSI